MCKKYQANAPKIYHKIVMKCSLLFFSVKGGEELFVNSESTGNSLWGELIAGRLDADTISTGRQQVPDLQIYG